MASRPRPATAIAIGDGRILALGDEAAARRWRSDGARVLDFGDRPILPGFIDTHVHFEIQSVAVGTAVGIHTPPCRSIDDIVATLRDNLHLAEARGGWLVGEGNLMQDQRLTDGRLPTRQDLDRVSTRIPIALRIGGHTTALNTRALGVVGFGRRFRMPRGAVLETDEHGKPNGLVREVFYALPIPLPSEDLLRAGLQRTMRESFTRFGVTAIGEIPRTISGVTAMDELLATGSMHCRIRVFARPGPMGTFGETLEFARNATLRSPSELIRITGIKLFADGGLTSATAAVLRPYAVRPGSRGRMTYTRPRLRGMIEEIAANGFQPIIHAVGERAQLAVCEAALDLGLDAERPSLHPRLEHAGNFVSDQSVMDLWARAGTLPVPNIVMIYSFGSYMDRYLGRYAETGRFPLRDLLEAGWRVPSGSDTTGDEPQATNPLFGIWAAVARESFDDVVVEPEQALTVEEALRMCTIDAAAALGEEADLGSIEPGKRADLVVLESDPRTVAVDKLPVLRVDAVFLGGRQVHSRRGAAPPAQIDAA